MKKSVTMKHGWLAALALLLLVQVAVLIYFGSQKEGFHEDEYYSYYSTNRTAGLYQPDREWMDRDTFRNEFVVLDGEGFNYGLVAMVQSWDVHPPLYYFILHTACSLFPGVFSKWLGIGVNILAFCINFVLLCYLTYMVTGKNKVLTFLVAAVHGLNAVIISGVMFIRMYEWLTVFVLLCACLHVRAVIKKDMGIRTFLLPLTVTAYLGFLTQYYFIIFLFFMAAGFCVWRLWTDIREKEKVKLWSCIKNCVKYGLSCGIGLMLAVLSYPASLSHIFRGYRGTGAVTEFINGANTFDRLGFFAGLMNDYLFDGFLWLWLLVIAGMVIFLLVKKSWGRTVGEETFGFKTIPYFLLLFTVCGYFFTVSKTALLLYETSNRYQLPIYGIVLLLVIAAVYELGRRIIDILGKKDAGKIKRYGTVGIAILFAAFLIGDIHGLLTDKVIFLYEEDKAAFDYAKENTDETVVVLYNDATPYNVWWCAGELMEYDKVYFVSEGNKELLKDAEICQSDKVIVYAADYETQQESLEMILESISGLESYELISNKSLWSVYEFR